MKKLLFCMALTAIAFACQNNQTTNTMKTFTQIDPKEISDNVVKLMADDWMLITAGNQENFNTMTASWGAIGNLWNKPVAFMFIRPQRYTFEFTENTDTFTLSFFDETYRDALTICGTKSGRDGDKIKEAGLTPRVMESGNMAFEEASMIIECRKIYADFFDAEKFIDETIAPNVYKTGDFHKMYIGEIVNVWLKK